MFRFVDCYLYVCVFPGNISPYISLYLLVILQVLYCLVQPIATPNWVKVRV